MSVRPLARIRRLVPALALALGSATVVAVGSAAPAAADDSCYVKLDAPSKIKIDRPYKKVDVNLIDSCGIAEYAAFTEYGPRGLDNIFIFDGNDSDVWDVYAFQTTGTFQTRLSGAYDSSYNEIDYRSTTTKIKLGTRASISSSRSGSKVKLTVKASSYRPFDEKYAAWNPSSAKVEYRSHGHWKTLKNVKLKGGKATVTRKVSAKRTYRFTVAESGSRWGTTSHTTRR